MMAAASNPAPEVSTVLLNAGAKLDDRDNKGVTPLVFEARFNTKIEAITINESKTAANYAERNMDVKGTDTYVKLEKPHSEPGKVQ